MRLELNNSGSWKTIIHDIDPARVADVCAAVRQLMACDATTKGRTTWRITEPSDVRPGGRQVAVTQGSGAGVVWVMA